MTRSRGFDEAASRSCAHGLLLGSDRSRAARLSLRRSRMPRALESRFAGARYKVLVDVDTVGPEDMDTSSLSVASDGRSCRSIACGLVSILRPRAAGDFDRFRACSSCQPIGVGGIGVSVVCPGLRVGGAAGGASLLEGTSKPRGPRLCDLELLGGGPGGGGGIGILVPQFPWIGVGDCSIGVLPSARLSGPAEIARRPPGGLITGDSGNVLDMYTCEDRLGGKPGDAGARDRASVVFMRRASMLLGVGLESLFLFLNADRLNLECDLSREADRSPGFLGGGGGNWVFEVALVAL
jgi:hypothetical protein